MAEVNHVNDKYDWTHHVHWRVATRTQLAAVAIATTSAVSCDVM